MSIYAFCLAGWDDTSTWGEDHGTLYAQLNRNDHDDSGGPQYWITPPHYPVVHTPAELGAIIATITATEADAVLEAMSTGARLAGATDRERHRLGLPV